MRDAAERAGEQREHAGKFRLIVARDMPGNRRDLEAQDLEHALLRLKPFLRLRGERADGAGHLADEDAFLHALEALDLAAQFIGPDGCLVAECDGDGMDDMRAAGFRRITVFLDELEDGLEACLSIAQDDIIGIALQENHARVDNVLARSTPVHVLAGMLRQDFLEGIEERHNRDGALVALTDGRNVDEVGLRILHDDIGLLLRDDAELTLSLCQSCFRIQPFLHPGLLREDFIHFLRTEQETVNLAVDDRC